MGGLFATSPVLAYVLADLGDSVAQFVSTFLTVYILLLFAYVITSWVRLPYRPWLNRIQKFLYDVCDPYLRLFRRFIPPLGPLDLSPMLAIISLVILRGILDSLIRNVL
ncbi:MAG TPA: YggT family protein [Gaiellaceae bacterium]|nr:YggT family protein [Gaiellaceae bacterium]